jgi:septal ring factor EnvC (AmiA/AmiB activator)
MGERDRLNLEKEVEEHRARIAEVAKNLRAIEDDLKSDGADPEMLERRAAALRLELRGRNAAVAVGSSILDLA